jgi:predicted small lipoprotein YifL
MTGEPSRILRVGCLVLVAACLVLSACGRKGPPVAPVAPAATPAAETLATPE